MALVRAIESTHQQRGRGQLVVQFFEKRRRKTYFFGKADEDVCWEQWTLDVTLATPRTETGIPSFICHWTHGVCIVQANHMYRCPQSPPRNDQIPRESRTQNHSHREPRQRPYPTHHHDRRESVPVPGRRQPEDSCRPEYVGAEDGHLLKRLGCGAQVGQCPSDSIVHMEGVREEKENRNAKKVQHLI